MFEKNVHENTDNRREAHLRCSIAADSFFARKTALYGNDVSEDAGLSSILWRIRSVRGEGGQKRHCVTSSVTAIRAPAYKEVARAQKKSRKKENPKRNWTTCVTFLFLFFVTGPAG